MTTLDIVPASADHIETIGSRMRQADIDEVFAISGRGPRSALRYSMEKSVYSWTILFDGVPEAMFGVGDINILSGIGAPWLLGTDAIERNYRLFLKTSVGFRDQLLSRYPIMRNLVDERNTVSRRWLAWLGAEFSEPMNVNGHSFRIFELRSADV